MHLKKIIGMNYMLSNTQMNDLMQGYVVWANYPLTDKLDKFKRRPVLIISNHTSNSLDDDYIVLPITKSVRDEPFSIIINPDDVQGDLPVSSQLRCNKPFTLRSVLMLEIIGILDQTKVEQSIILLKDSVSSADTTIAD